MTSLSSFYSSIILLASIFIEIRNTLRHDSNLFILNNLVNKYNIVCIIPFLNALI